MKHKQNASYPKGEMIDKFKEEYTTKNELSDSEIIEVGYDIDGNYYFLVAGKEDADPNGNWDYDVYADGDIPYYKLQIGEQGEYIKAVHLSDLNDIESASMINNPFYLWEQNISIAKLQESNEVLAVPDNFIEMVINEREPAGLFYTENNGIYTAVDNSTGDAWTEAFSDLNTCKKWLSSNFEYYTEMDYRKVMTDGGKLDYPLKARIESKDETIQDFVADLYITDPNTKNEVVLGIINGDPDIENDFYICPVDPDNKGELLVVQLEDIIVPEKYNEFKSKVWGGEFQMNLKQNDLLIDLEEYYEDEKGDIKIEHANDKLYWYEMVKRPISIGSQPKGFVVFDEDKGRHGIVAYNNELTDKELSDYEMQPWEENKKELDLRVAPMWEVDKALFHYGDKERAQNVFGKENVKLKWAVMDEDYFIGTSQFKKNFAYGVYENEANALEHAASGKSGINNEMFNRKSKKGGSADIER